MKKLLLLVACSLTMLAPLAAEAAEPGTSPTSSPLPPQLEVRVPFEPTAFPSLDNRYLAYELRLTNFSGTAMNIRRIEVLDGDGDGAGVVTAFEGEQLGAILQTIGQPSAGQLGPGATAVAYLWLSFENGAPVPSRLRHRVVLDDGTVESAIIGTQNGALHVLASPLRGEGWKASDGPSNDRNNHHRRGILAIGGQAVISRRYATDWFLYKNGKSLIGDKYKTQSYYAYGQPVYAVADAVVVKAKDGQPDNVPGPVETFHTAVPKTMDTVGGNNVVLDLGGGHYAWYLHLRPGSVKVKPGDHVRRGQPLGQIGCSGDTNLPHLHFEIANSPNLLAGEGEPYVIDHYKIQAQDKSWQPRERELPLDRMLIDFGSGDEKGK